MNAQTLGGGKLRKLAIQMVTGALAGGLTTFLFFSMMKGRGVAIDDPAHALALGVGLLFILMGAGVGLGALAPKAGSKFLNVEDADELREQQEQLKYGALVFVLAGIALLALSLGGGPAGPGILSPGVAAGIALTCFGGVTWCSIVSRNATDELMRSLGREASTATCYIVMIAAAIWATVSMVVPVTTLSPLGLLAGLLALNLIVIMVVAARRGLLSPR